MMVTCCHDEEVLSPCQQDHGCGKGSNIRLQEWEHPFPKCSHTGACRKLTGRTEKQKTFPADFENPADGIQTRTVFKHGYSILLSGSIATFFINLLNPFLGQLSCWQLPYPLLTVVKSGFIRSKHQGFLISMDDGVIFHPLRLPCLL